MNTGKLLFLFFVMLLSGVAFGQDRIYKTDGTVIEAKIRTVGERSITYVLYSDPHGPEYSALQSDVDKIRYENGSEESFRNDNSYVGRSGIRHINLPSKYRPTVLAFAPIQFTENGIAGVSVSYERAIDKQGIAAFYMPAILEFNVSNTGNTNNGNPMFYLMPGIKIYPTGSYGPCKYAIGPSFVIADGEKTGNTYDQQGNPITSFQQSHFLMGIMVNQSININPTPHFYIGCEFGLGYTYVDDVAGANQGESVLVNFAFKLGIRY